MDEEEIPIHQSLVRPQLIAGAERTLVWLNGIILMTLIAGLHLHPVALLAAVVFACGHFGLVRAAKYDPQLSEVYLEQLTYQGFYPAHSDVHASPALELPSVPVRG